MKKHTGKIIWGLCQICVVIDTYILWLAFSESMRKLGESVQIAPTTFGFSVTLCVTFGAGCLLIGCVSARWCFSATAHMRIKAVLPSSKDRTASKMIKAICTLLLLGCLLVWNLSCHSPYMFLFCMFSIVIILLWLLIYSSWRWEIDDNSHH